MFQIEKVTTIMSLFIRIEPLPKLTKRQIECLRFIAAYLMQHSDYPTQREISSAMGLRSNTAYAFTEPLKKKGYLEISKDVGKRNLRLTDSAYHLFDRIQDGNN